MSLFEAILLGIIQGLTEFIPVSSTAHLTLGGRALGLIDPDNPAEWTAFIAVMQLGTLIAVFAYFWTDILRITQGFIITNLAKVTKREVSQEHRENSYLGWLVILGTIPVGIFGLLFKDYIEGKLTKDLRVIACSLIGLALLLGIAEVTGKQKRGIKEVGIRDALMVGLAQVLALVPGSSRSGTTITGGLFAGLNREAAARFSFLLSIPAITASGLLELPKAIQSVGSNWGALVVATVVSGISGYLSIAFLLQFLQKHSTFSFIVYRIVLGLVILGLVLSGRIAP